MSPLDPGLIGGKKSGAQIPMANTCVTFEIPTIMVDVKSLLKKKVKNRKKITLQVNTTTHAVASSRFPAFSASKVAAFSRGPAFILLNTPAQTSAKARWISPRHFGSTVEIFDHV